MESGKICEICGYTGRDSHFHTHHIDRDRKNNSEKNLACLCIDCHREIHKKIRSGYDGKIRNRAGIPENLKFKRSIVNTLPLFYRAMAEHLEETNRAIIIEDV